MIAPPTRCSPCGAEPVRDFFDVAALIDHYGHDRLLELAEAKGNGFTRDTFIDALRAIA